MELQILSHNVVVGIKQYNISYLYAAITLRRLYSFLPLQEVPMEAQRKNPLVLAVWAGNI